MLAAAREMGLPDARGERASRCRRSLAAAALAERSDESPETLRRNVTSPAGTTHAAMTVLELRGMKSALVEAIRAARDRARELGDEFDASA